jgi:hypothetical protein
MHPGSIAGSRITFLLSKRCDESADPAHRFPTRLSPCYALYGEGACARSPYIFKVQYRAPEGAVYSCRIASIGITAYWHVLGITRVMALVMASSSTCSPTEPDRVFSGTFPNVFVTFC